MKKEVPFLFSSAQLANHHEVGENVAYIMVPLNTLHLIEKCAVAPQRKPINGAVFFQTFINHNLNNREAILYLKDL